MKLIPFLLTIIFSVSSFSQTKSSSELRKMESINSRLEQLKRNLQKIKQDGQTSPKSITEKPTQSSETFTPSLARPSSKSIPAITNPIAPTVQPEVRQIQPQEKPDQTDTDAVISRIRNEMKSIEGLLSRASGNSTARPSANLDIKTSSTIQPSVNNLTKSKAQLEYDALSPTTASSGNSTPKKRDFDPTNEYITSRQKHSDRFDSKSSYQKTTAPSDIRTESGKKNLKSAESNLEKKNSFNFYYGFSIPNLSEYQGNTLKFKNGHEFNLEYLRDFGLLSLGASYSFKTFDNERWTLSGGGVPQDLTGTNTFHTFTLSAGIEPEVNELMFLRARFSGGFSLRKHDLHFTGGFQEEFSETSFHYAFLAGLGFRWSENFHSLLFYKFDGSTETVNFGHASFHQFGLGFGLDY